eukprot:2325920-Rhodomonas_salina.2
MLAHVPPTHRQKKNEKKKTKKRGGEHIEAGVAEEAGHDEEVVVHVGAVGAVRAQCLLCVTCPLRHLPERHALAGLAVRVVDDHAVVVALAVAADEVRARAVRVAPVARLRLVARRHARDARDRRERARGDAGVVDVQLEDLREERPCQRLVLSDGDVVGRVVQRGDGDARDGW